MAGSSNGSQGLCQITVIDSAYFVRVMSRRRNGLRWGLIDLALSLIFPNSDRDPIVT